MKVLFLGYAVDLDSANHLSGASVAGNKMQVQVLKELNAYEDVQLSCITIYPIAAFPKEKRIFISKQTIPVIDNVTAVRVSFLNLPIVKQIHQTINVYFQARRMADKDTIILSFNLFPQVGVPLAWLKKKYSCMTYSLLADLPIDDNVPNKNILRNFFRSIFDALTRRALKACDKLIVLNGNAAQQFAPGKEYVVMEGGIDPANVSHSIIPYVKRKKTIIYSGALTEYSGIIQLIEAMDKVSDQSAVLEIYGGGYLSKWVEEQSEIKRNVRYCGKVDYQTMITIQQSAYILVNPRPVIDDIAKVTFPSKIFEYLASGTAVLTTELNGLSKDYLENVYHVANNEPQLLADGINNILLKSHEELQCMVNHAQMFVLKHKTWKKQTKIIHDFMGENLSNQ